MWIVHLIVALLFLLLALLFDRGKGAFLIAGYNTLSKEEQSRYDEKGLCRFMARLMPGLAGCFLLMMLRVFVGGLWPLWLGWILFSGLVVFALLYLNTGNRFAAENQNSGAPSPGPNR